MSITPHGTDRRGRTAKLRDAWGEITRLAAIETDGRAPVRIIDSFLLSEHTGALEWRFTQPCNGTTLPQCHPEIRLPDGVLRSDVTLRPR